MTTQNNEREAVDTLDYSENSKSEHVATSSSDDDNKNSASEPPAILDSK